MTSSPTPGGNQLSSLECQVAGLAWKTGTEMDLEAWLEDPENDCILTGECTPLVLDMNGGGIDTSSALTHPVDFDIDGDGILESIGWTLEDTEDAFLWLDLNSNRRVDGAGELFGSASTDPRGNPVGAADGFEVLALYDDARFGGNGDGRIDRLDSVWSRLRLWADRNHDGVSTRDEISPVQRSRIVRFDVSYEPVGVRDGNLNLIVARGRFWVRGPGGDLRERAVVDVAFLNAAR